MSETFVSPQTAVFNIRSIPLGTCTCRIPGLLCVAVLYGVIMIEKISEYALEQAVVDVITNSPGNNPNRRMCWHFMTALF